jgi:hypothetical protein
MVKRFIGSPAHFGSILYGAHAVAGGFDDGYLEHVA